jgi:hypothetical protein
MRPRQADDLTLHIGPQKLSDGSIVYNVHLGLSDIVLHAVDEESALALANGIAELIEMHTVDVAYVRNHEVRAA